jgi:leucyl-tRNA synthetase
MKKYNHQQVEKKWQKYWEAKKVFKTNDKAKGKKKYILDMFPYPSGAGLHVGHPEGYTATDILARYSRMNGFNVLHPMGWDAFGLPAENYAIKMGVHPQKTTQKNIKRFTQQIKSIGLSYDWSRELNTSDPEYYKWTQWLFLQFYKKGLAYKKLAAVNWCPKDNTVLANEQVVDGKCERCGSEVVQKKLSQWFFKITDYAEELLSEIDKLDWPEPIKLMQRNWIGKSQGAEVEFEIGNKKLETRNFVLLHGFKGSASGIFFPWLKQSLEQKGYKFQAPNLPNPSLPTEEEQVNFVLKNCQFNENTVLFGHSLGAVVAMKVVEKLPHKIAGLVLAGGFTSPVFKDHQRPYNKKFNWQFDFAKIKNQCGFVKILSDPTDFAVPLEQGVILKEKLYGELIEQNGQKPHFMDTEEPAILQALVPFIKVFTTRPDTLFGATYMVLAPEHEIVQSLKSQILNFSEVEKYLEETKKKSELQRTQLEKEKTGVELKGIKVINPATKQEIPVWIADYVITGYGTGAIMAVPAHDERDFEFAKKFNLPIKQVVAPLFNADDEGSKPKEDKKTVGPIDVVFSIIKHTTENKYLVVKHHRVDKDGYFAVTGAVDSGEDFIIAAKREILEETGYKNVKLIKELGEPVYFKFFKKEKDENRLIKIHPYYFELVNEEIEAPSEYEKAKQEPVWLSEENIEQFLKTRPFHRIFWSRLKHNSLEFSKDPGYLINSQEFDGLDFFEAQEKIATKFGKLKTQYKLRDWLVSRQRYWGAPIPIIYCPKCGEQPVPEKDLPVKLPTDADFRPTGESPLKRSKKFSKVDCPKCKGKAERDYDTMDTFVDSSWYFLRFADSKNKKAFADKKNIKTWAPVNMYVGGAEHAVMHLLYARFFTKVLRDLGYLNFGEPFLALKNQGLILGPDGEKMSKSRGNVINPDDVIKESGADSLRMYEMFMGPFEDQKPWQTNGIVGVKRFLERVWGWVVEKQTVNSKQQTVSEKATRELHKLIKKVTEDIEGFHFNTSVSAFMQFHNDIKDEPVSKEFVKTFLTLLYPFAPHMTEELNQKLESRNQKSLQFEKWPKFDPALVIDNEIEIIVQVNGKVKGKMVIARGLNEDKVKEEALKIEAVKQVLQTAQIKKVINVPNRLINFVI